MESTKGGHVADHDTAADQSRPPERRAGWDCGNVAPSWLVTLCIVLVLAGLLTVRILHRM